VQRSPSELTGEPSGQTEQIDRSTSPPLSVSQLENMSGVYLKFDEFAFGKRNLLNYIPILSPKSHE
jgi:hypothetical protein